MREGASWADALSRYEEKTNKADRDYRDSTAPMWKQLRKALEPGGNSARAREILRLIDAENEKRQVLVRGVIEEIGSNIGLRTIKGLRRADVDEERRRAAIAFSLWIVISAIAAGLLHYVSASAWMDVVTGIFVVASGITIWSLYRHAFGRRG